MPIPMIESVLLNTGLSGQSLHVSLYPFCAQFPKIFLMPTVEMREDGRWAIRATPPPASRHSVTEEQFAIVHRSLCADRSRIQYNDTRPPDGSSTPG
jgi:hypothetical protein